MRRRWPCPPSPDGTCTSGPSRRCRPTGPPGSAPARSPRSCWRSSRRATRSTSRRGCRGARCWRRCSPPGSRGCSSLAFVDGADGIGHVLETPYEYLRTARKVTDVHQLLQEYVSRIPYSSAPQPNWPVHVAGHPPGALLFFVGLDRVGLGGGLAAGMVVTVIAATTAVAVLLTVRALGDEANARRAAPFLVFAPAAVWQAVSADAMFAAVAAWGLAALALAGTRRSAAWAVAAGLLLGACVMLSYGLLLLGILALTVVALGRWWPSLPIAAVAALAVVVAFARARVLLPRCAAGPPRALPRRRRRTAPGELLDLGRPRRARHQRRAARRRRPRAAAGRRASLGPTRAVAALAAAGFASVLVADVTQMSKAEVERIWLPVRALDPAQLRAPARALAPARAGAPARGRARRPAPPRHRLVNRHGGPGCPSSATSRVRR